MLGAGAVVAWLLARPRPTRALVPHTLYVLSLLVVFLAAGGTGREPRAVAAGRVRRRRWPRRPRRCRSRAAALVGVHVGCLLLVWLQLAGPRSAFDTVDRAGFYHALEHWSGYPELGLLMAVATCAMVAFACAARPPLVRVAAAVLALAFARGDGVPAIAIRRRHDPGRRRLAARSSPS